MTQAVGYAADDAKAPLKPCHFERQEPGPDEVQIEILYCGVCHSDLHQARNDWGNTIYPCLPGHEIVGRVTKVGAQVTKLKEGDLAGVGCMVDSCGHCLPCREGIEQYCEGPKGWTATYNGPQKPDGTNTFGGYSDSIVVKEHFVLKVPTSLDAAAVASLMCAGVTTYSPLRHWNVGASQRVGVVGLGGLGHMAVKLAKAMGAYVDAMAAHELTCDYILSTIPDPHDPNPYIQCLKRDATLTLVGTLAPLDGLNNQQLAFHRRTFAGSLIGGIAETQEVLDFCAAHNIAADVEIIPIDKINEAYDRMMKRDVKYRFVIDMSSLKNV